MIITEFVEISIKGNNKLSYYKNLGYDITKNFYVKIEDITKNSKSIIEAKCDFCSNIKKISYFNYKRNIERGGFFSCSKKCSIGKTKITNLEKYGGSTPMSSDIIKEKAKITNLNKYGREFTFQSEDIKEKIRKTNLEKYGVDNPSKSEDIKEKIRKTNLEIYGVDNPSKSEDIKEKIRKTNLEKYGVEYYTNSEYFKNNKILIKEKIRKTNLEKYKNTSPVRSELYRKEHTKIANDLNYLSYDKNGVSLFICDLGKDHEFLINVDNYIGRSRNNIPLCTFCNPIGNLQSIKENELFEYIKNIYNGKIIKSFRDGLEIDIYLPELKIGFEFNGLYWHSEKFKDSNYHLKKTNYFKEKSIRIIHIWEDDWVNKNTIIKSQIINWLGLIENKIFARRCQVKEIKNTKMVNNFLKENHIQGNVRSCLKLGLFYDNELVSLMTFDHFEGRKKMFNNEWNLSRFCNKLNTQVVGGASKILKHFIKSYDVERIVSYADKGWSNGNLYENIGFNKLYDVNPDYKYIINNVRFNKSSFRKSRTGISESKLDINKIWDCGKIKYEINI